jgi:hypothetical protein
MKFGIAILTALAIVACGRIALADENDKAVVVKAADQAVVEPAPRLYGRPHRHVVRPLPYPYPAACEAVLFPRSPLCAGRPASYGYYAPYPWNLYWSY